MKFKLKTKISFVLILIFILISTIGFVGILYIYRLADASDRIMQDNYDSVYYVENMLEDLENTYAYQLNYLHSDSIERETMEKDKAKYQTMIVEFKTELEKQINNITEPDEYESTQELKNSFENYIQAFEQVKNTKLDNKNTVIKRLVSNYLSVRKAMDKIYQVNMNAIILKNETAQNTAGSVITYMRILVTFSILVTLFFIFILPAYLGDPIIELTSKIKEITNKNFNQKLILKYKTNDEISELAENFNTMVAKLQEYDNSNVAKLLFEKKRTDAVIKVFNDAILILDEKKNIVNANDIAQDLLGLSQRQMLAEPTLDLMKKNDLLRLLMNELISNESLKPTDEAENINDNIIKIFADERESFFVKDVIHIDHNEDRFGQKELAGYVISLKNVTDLKEIDKAKTNFIATISHELKTPIASIKMSLQLLNNEKIGSLNPEQAELLNHVSEDAERMLKIVKELLNLAELETGNMTLKVEEVQPQKLLEYAYKTVQNQAVQKNVLIQISQVENLYPAKVDFEKTGWVLINLLSNAIRYSPENEKIKIDLSQRENELFFTISNKGDVIPDEYKKKIFERFFQIPDTNKDKNGTGLGLAICKEIIETQNGDIWFENRDNTNVFCFTLPVYKTVNLL